VSHLALRRPAPHGRIVRLAAMGLAAALSAGLAGCATPTRPAAPADAVGAAFTQPFRDLSLVRSEPPAQLAAAAAAPYQPAQGCVDLQGELAVLDSWLGPDVDAPSEAHDAASLAADAVTGVIGLPFRNVVRRLSGAHKRDQKVAAVILGAMIRRGFLRGQARALACAAPAP
jgi:hypothetical protein